GGKVTAFVGLIESLRNGTQNLPLPEIVEHVLQHSGLVTHYETEKASVSKRREAEERLENLNELISSATLFVHENEDDSLTAFLTHATLESGEHQAGDSEDALHLMTVHSAKGLEFHTVFITGLEESLFPHQNSIDNGDLDEERRLMYVAITRARKRLYLSHSQTRMLHGQTRYNMKSRFFDELPEACLKWLTPQQPAWGAPGGAGGGGGQWQNGRRSFGAPPALQPSWSPGFNDKGDHKGLGQKAPEPDRGTDIRAGMAVFHNKFGEGKVLSIEGAGDDARAQVNFSRHGTKWLALSVAKLTPIV
ncbi:MAG: 3'-5' exonuclease, partial [Hydrogenophaga sp.]|nr:3'-5' exonuclease [Hydrogenophaga sp.]